MSYSFSENDFSADGNFVGGNGYFMNLLHQNDDDFNNALAELDYGSHGDTIGFGGHVPQPLDGIDQEDPSLYRLPLTSDERANFTMPSLPTLPGVSGPLPVVPNSVNPSTSIPSRSLLLDIGGTSMKDQPCDGNSSTWAARNPTFPVIRCRMPPSGLSVAHKASRKIRADQQRTRQLQDSIAKNLDEQRTKIEALALTHNVTPKRINDIIVSQTKFHNSRKVSLNNALVHAKAKEVNAGQPAGSRHALGVLCKMVTEDPQMNNLTGDQKAGFIEALNEDHTERVNSVRANNMAAARDVLITTERIVTELDDLRIRTGVYATVFVVRSHVNDTIQSTMHGTDNSEDFWEDVYEHPMADFLRQYEQWACTQNQNLNERDSLESVCKQVRKMIIRGLVALTGRSDIAMNYVNYETAIIETYGVHLVGWPQGLKFIGPSNIGTVGDIRMLRDALKARTCYWTALMPSEVKTHTAELDTRRSVGEVVRKPRKKRSDAGISRKRKALGNKENNRPAKKVKKIAAQVPAAPKSAEFIESSDKDLDSELIT